MKVNNFNSFGYGNPEKRTETVYLTPTNKKNLLNLFPRSNYKPNELIQFLILKHYEIEKIQQFFPPTRADNSFYDVFSHFFLKALENEKKVCFLEKKNNDLITQNQFLSEKCSKLENFLKNLQSGNSKEVEENKTIKILEVAKICRSEIDHIVGNEQCKWYDFKVELDLSPSLVLLLQNIIFNTVYSNHVSVMQNYPMFPNVPNSIFHKINTSRNYIKKKNNAAFYLAHQIQNCKNQFLGKVFKLLNLSRFDSHGLDIVTINNLQEIGLSASSNELYKYLNRVDVIDFLQKKKKFLSQKTVINIDDNCGFKVKRILWSFQKKKKLGEIEIKNEKKKFIQTATVMFRFCNRIICKDDYIPLSLPYPDNPLEFLEFSKIEEKTYSQMLYNDFISAYNCVKTNDYRTILRNSTNLFDYEDVVGSEKESINIDKIGNYFQLYNDCIIVCESVIQGFESEKDFIRLTKLEEQYNSQPFLQVGDNTPYLRRRNSLNNKKSIHQQIIGDLHQNMNQFDGILKSPYDYMGFQIFSQILGRKKKLVSPTKDYSDGLKIGIVIYRSLWVFFIKKYLSFNKFLSTCNFKIIDFVNWGNNLSCSLLRLWFKFITRDGFLFVHYFYSFRYNNFDKRNLLLKLSLKLFSHTGKLRYLDESIYFLFDLRYNFSENLKKLLRENWVVKCRNKNKFLAMDEIIEIVNFILKKWIKIVTPERIKYYSSLFNLLITYNKSWDQCFGNTSKPSSFIIPYENVVDLLSKIEYNFEKIKENFTSENGFDDFLCNKIPQELKQLYI